MFQELKWLPFDEIVKFKQVSLVYKAVTGDAPQYIQTLFTYIKDHSKYSLKSSTNNKLFVPRTPSQIIFLYRRNYLECSTREYKKI